MKKNLFTYFPHPIFQYKLDNYENHNKEYSQYIYDLQKEDSKGQKLSNVNGWHSPFFDLSSRETVGYKFLMKIQPYIADVFKSYGWVFNPQKVKCSGMWAIINKKGNFNTEHIHPNSNLSGAYYVSAPKNCGKFKVVNPHSISRDKFPPRENPNELNRLVAEHEIEDGDLLIFPSYLPHSVLPNQSDDDRIVISFNIFVSP
jgi:uncharacterized protein (TIGR02466 family)